MLQYVRCVRLKVVPGIRKNRRKRIIEYLKRAEKSNFRVGTPLLTLTVHLGSKRNFYYLKKKCFSNYENSSDKSLSEILFRLKLAKIL